MKGENQKKKNLKKKTGECVVNDDEKLPRQSGSLQWRKDRGEI